MAARTVKRADHDTSDADSIYGQKSGLLMEGEAAQFAAKEKPDIALTPSVRVLP